jgi:hypothetical protein
MQSELFVFGVHAKGAETMLADRELGLDNLARAMSSQNISNQSTAFLDHLIFTSLFTQDRRSW